jgi:hypothetical protein
LCAARGDDDAVDVVVAADDNAVEKASLGVSQVPAEDEMQLPHDRPWLLPRSPEQG